MEKLTWYTEKRIVNSLLPYSSNPRRMSASQTNSLKKSLERFNLVEIPAIDKDNKIVSGHQRVRVLQLLGRGDEEIDVRVPNRKLTEDEYNRYLISANAISGDWDYELLRDFEIDMLNDIGFNSNDLANIWDDIVKVNKDDDFDEEAELAKIKIPVTKNGDIVLLGNNRLICGDSTDQNVVNKLCGEARVDMILSDPIYNLNIDYNKGLGGHQNFGGDVEDNRSEQEYIDFLRKSMMCALSVAKKDCHVFYWNTEQQIWIIQTLYRELGISNKRVCIWIKNGHNLTPHVSFNKCYEPCIYGSVGQPYLSKKEQGLNEIMNRNMTSGNNLLEEIDREMNIWPIKRLPAKDYEHATSKPPELSEKAIRRCTKPGDIILDSFGGSGSTLIAGEQLKRRVYMVEKEPVFCDLIIRRFEKLTGIKAKVIRNNEKAQV
jgi:DNA modification methylase